MLSNIWVITLCTKFICNDVTSDKLFKGQTPSMPKISLLREAPKNGFLNLFNTVTTLHFYHLQIYSGDNIYF